MSNIFKRSEDDKMPWYENVYELLTFSNLQYKIDLQQDYYPDEKCFISKYGLNSENIAILCSIDFPTDIIIKGFTDFVKRQGLNFSKILIAIKNYEGEIETINKYDLEIIIRNESEMLNSLIDFSSYKQFISESFTRKEITDGNNYTLKDIYVPLVGKNDKEIEIGEVEKYIHNWLNNSQENKHLAILGEYGCGKSVLSTKITHDLLTNISNDSRIPIFIELRGKSPRNLDVTEILSTWASKYRLDAASLLKLHKAGKLLIIFEGFDEMDMIGDREMRLNHFQRLWEFAIPKSKIIITGRPNFFLDDKELKMNLGIDKPYESSHYCEAIYLEKFNTDQIKLALRNVDENTKEQVIDILDKSTNSNFYDLISRPAILYLVAVIWKERKLSLIKDNINSAIVISEFIKYSYSRQSNKNILFPLSEKEREYFMLGIAVGMLQQTQYSNQINKNDLENIFLKLYKNFPNEITSSENALQPNRKPLKERMMDSNSNQAEDTVLTDVRSCGILVNDLTRKDYSKFAHKSFLEYQVSLYFVESILQDKGDYNIIMNSVSKALDITITATNFRHSRETISFTSEILITKLKLNKSDDPYNVCKKLFEILYPHKRLGKFPKLASIFDIYFQSSFFILFNTVSVIALSISLLLLSPWLIIVVIVAIVAVFRLFIIVMDNSLIAKDFKRTSIWLKCCNQLNIPEETICRVVPKRYLLFLQGNRPKDPISTMLGRILGQMSDEDISKIRDSLR